MKISLSKSGPAAVAIVFAALAFRLFRLASEYAVNIFFWDQWDFNDATLFQHHSVWGIFRFQHGPHRQGVGGVLAALVEPWFRWNSRTEAFLLVSLVVVAGLCMLWLKYRLFGPLGWADVAIPILVFTPAQWESSWSIVNFAHGVLPVLLIVLYCLAWTWSNERAKYGTVTGLNFLTLYTGFGFFLGLLTPVLLLARYREVRDKTQATRIYLLVCVALSVASLASFFVNYQNNDASGCASIFAEPPLSYVRFLGLMFATPWSIRDIGIAGTVAGGMALAGVAAVAAFSWRGVLSMGPASNTPRLVVAILSAYTILFCAAATLGRTCLGFIGAHASRYAMYKQLGVLSLFFWVLALKQPVWRKAWSYVLLILLIPSVFLTEYDKQGMTELYTCKRGWRDCYLSGRTIDTCDDQNGAIYPVPQDTHLQQKLDFLRATRQNLFADGPEVRR